MCSNMDNRLLPLVTPKTEEEVRAHGVKRKRRNNVL